MQLKLKLKGLGFTTPLLERPPVVWREKIILDYRPTLYLRFLTSFFLQNFCPKTDPVGQRRIGLQQKKNILRMAYVV